jgi:2-haloacid dehalogenase
VKFNEHAASGSGRVDWITFDCYGTLIDWERGVADALGPFLPPGVDRAALAARYIAIEAAVEGERYRRYRDVLAETAARVMEALGHPLPAGRERVLADALPTWRPFPEAPQALGALRAAGYRLAILSNVDRDLLVDSVAQLAVQPDLTVTAEDCQSYKPARAHWDRFQKLSGTPPARTVHVAASVFHDIVPATALGYRTVFVNRHNIPIAEAAPTRVLADLRALPRTIAELAGS